MAVSRLASADRDAQGGRPCHRSQAGAAVDADDGDRGAGPKSNTTKPAPGHKIYPYLLRNLVITRPNHVWAADITYVPLGWGFLYPVAIIDWSSRLAARLVEMGHASVKDGFISIPRRTVAALERHEID